MLTKSIFDFQCSLFCFFFLLLLLKFVDENNSSFPSRWSVPELKDRQANISIFSRIYEEYTDAEHFFEFTRKTAAILLQTSSWPIDSILPCHTVPFRLEIAAFVFSVSLVLPVIMIGVGKSLFIFFIAIDRLARDIPMEVYPIWKNVH